MFALILCYFFYAGFDAFALLGIPVRLQNILSQLGIANHYAAMSRGVMDSRDLLYFVSLTTCFLLLARFTLEKKMVMSSGKQRKDSLLRLIASLVILVSVNIIGNFLFFRIDLTAEKRYSISDASRELAGSLNDVVYFKVYLDGELPPGFRRLRNATRELLDEFRIYAGGNIEYEFVDPSAEPEEKKRLELYKQLARKGLLPTNLEEREKAGVVRRSFSPARSLPSVGRKFPFNC